MDGGADRIHSVSGEAEARVAMVTPGAGVGRHRGSLLAVIGMRLLAALLRGAVRHGSLQIIAPNGRRWIFGDAGEPVTVAIARWSTAWRLFLNPDLALGEAYMDGTLVVEGDRLYDFLAVCLANFGTQPGHWLRRARSWLRRLGRRIQQHNPVGRARANVAHHYDLSDELYELFLEPGRQYSCAYFRRPDDCLEEAQQQKMRHIAAKLLLQAGHRVLDVGCGWGGLAVHLAATTGAQVTGVTLSGEQHGHAERRAAAAGLADSARFLIQDYRHLQGQFDRIVSVGMFEHVGIGHYPEYFGKIRDLLAPDGVALIHTIGAVTGPGAANPWIDKYIFPGGYTPALSEIVPAIEKAGLMVTDVEVWRLHYALTLRAWRDRFMAKREQAARLFDERFCRMWEFYLAICEAAFRHAGLVVFQIQISRSLDAVPLTRGYIDCASRDAAAAHSGHTSLDMGANA